MAYYRKMQLIDVVIVLLGVLALFRGAETGMVRQATTFLGLVSGLLIGSGLSKLVDGGALTALVLILIAISITTAISEFIGRHVAQAVIKIRLQPVNRTLGAGIGLAGMLLLVWLGASLVGGLPSTTAKTAVRDSKIIAWLDQSLPPSTTVLAWISDSLAQTTLPDVIQQFELTPPDTTATLPASSAFSPVLNQYSMSVVEIEGRSCGGIGVGSGFVAGDNIVITNAHVVAGMRYPYVSDGNGRHKAEVIGFNPDLDIAVLRVSNLAGSSIPLAVSDIQAGTQAIAVGFPGGGPQKASPSVVLETLRARSKDIYNESTTLRTIYTIKSDIEPGNSGGPLIDTSGTVIGVIFAKSTTYDQVGYAIAMPAVMQELETALQNQAAKDNLRCAID